MRKAARTGNAAQLGMFFTRAYASPAAPSTIQPASNAPRKPAGVVGIGLILASGFFESAALSQDPPPNLAKLVAQRESDTEKERSEYTYRQTVTLDELHSHGGARGQYRE